MRTGNCVRCGGIFEDRSPAQRRLYCSGRCRRSASDERMYHPVCADCGADQSPSTHGRNIRCQACEDVRRKRIAAERADRIVEWWGQGLSLKEIAARLGSTVNGVGTEITYLRRAGRDLPYRRRPKVGEAA